MKCTYSFYLFPLLILLGTPIQASKNLSGRTQLPTENITVDKGEEFILETQIASGTGYTKEFTIEHSSKKMVEMINSSTKELNTFMPMPGSPLTTTTIFKALKKGTATIVLESQAPGRNQPKKMEKIYKITIK
jgi:predicted secreted protein